MSDPKKKAVEDHVRKRQAINYRSTRRFTADTDRSGVRGEIAWAAFLGADPDLRIKPGGDGGIDLDVLLHLASGPTWVHTDAKFNSYGDNLLTERGKTYPETIYVLVGPGVAPALPDRCVGWVWGHRMLERPTKNWCGKGRIVHWRHITDPREGGPLCSMDDLWARFIAWRHSEVGVE